ncbi:dihydrofolate reductase family protein [Alistipes sp.]|uniref:dihydrofolate reductase family protein n=1 Tax=Alistipes sp. TaxID=1872444 RepID=UPI0023F34DFF|nr:dihydrofolate reductase family protein [Alistipes sp.]
MRVTLSAAVTADGYMDDDSPRRLIISTPGDWEEVYRLRAAHDAILAGAETLRRDDPSLLVRDQAARARRVQAGLKPDIAKVTLTRSGGLSPRLRFFTAGDADRYVFSPGEITGLQNIATVISTSEAITAKYIVTELEKRGIERLMVEGGAEVLRMFLDEGMADTLRLAVNPRLRLGGRGGASLDAAPLQSIPHTCEQVDDTHETSATHHAEQEAIAKALAAGAVLRGAAMYSSMEPCSRRASEPESCTQLIIRHGFARAAFALYEPDCFVCCRGALTLREAGLDVRAYPALANGVWEANAHLKR